MILPLSSRPGRSPRPWYRRRSATVAQVVAALMLLVILHSLYLNPSDPEFALPAANPGANRQKSHLLEKQAKFWRGLYHLILNNPPSCERPPEKVVPAKLYVEFDSTHERARPDILWLDPADLQRLKQSHSNFINDLQNTAPTLAYEPNTRGIVMTAGSSQLPVLVISLRMLRRTWSLLPVEVFLASDSEYDEQICEVVLPTLNAKCVLFSDIFHAATTGVELNRFQYKCMALLFSSFQEVLLLDSDAFPLYNPLQLFESEPFTSTGLVLWPDFWYASESPYFFEIAKITEIPPLTARAAVESGEILLDKTKHHASIMLATYYNFYGPQFYYPLLSQGAPGEGDKETFGWAATVLGNPMYAVHESVVALGRSDSSGTFIGSAMAQHDPVADYRFFSAQGRPESGKQHGEEAQPIMDSIRPFFIHANVPKFDPSTIFEYQTRGFENEILGEKGPTMDSNGTSVRCWNDEKWAMEVFGFDLERRFWEEIVGTACQHEDDFMIWKGKTGICSRAMAYWIEVFNGEGEKSSVGVDRSGLERPEKDETHI